MSTRSYHTAILVICLSISSFGALPAVGGLVAEGSQFWHQNVAGTLGGAEEYDLFGSSVATGDFDGDGFQDLAVGVKQENSWGVVQVFYGTSVGLAALDNEIVLHEPSEDSLPTPNVHSDRFGDAVASGDFDGDGYSDLVVGNPAYCDVTILYGSGGGLDLTRREVWSQGSEGIEGNLEDVDAFGSSLAVGDFDHDGFSDLAVGAPHEYIPELFPDFNCGAVNVIYGSDAGLTADGNRVWHQDVGGVLGGNEGGQVFGTALAAGDFNGDQYADLAIGVPGEGINGRDDAGLVNVLYGGPEGVAVEGNQWWYQGWAGVPGDLEAGDQFGTSLATGDFDDDGFDDLAVGVPFEDGDLSDIGLVNVIRGSRDGLTGVASQLWHQEIPGMVTDGEAGVQFGQALAVGDFDGIHGDDLAVGIPYADVGGGLNAGAVHVIYSNADGLAVEGNERWSQDSEGVADAAEYYDVFASHLAAGDFDGNSISDLAIGIYGEDLEPLLNCGAVEVLYGHYALSPVEPPAAAGMVRLRNAVPNPFNPRTTIAFELTQQEAVTLRVFDIAGRLVKTLMDREVYGQGRHEATWRGGDGSGRQCASGTYFYHLEAGTYSETKRMVLLK